MSTTPKSPTANDGRPEVRVTVGGVSYIVPKPIGQCRNDSVSTEDSDVSLISSASDSSSARAQKDCEAQQQINKRLSKIAITSIILAVAMTVTNIGVVVYVVLSEIHDATEIEDLRNIIASGRSERFCLPCADVTLTAPEENGIIREFEKRVSPDGIGECCAKDQTQFNVLLQRYVERKLRLIRAEGTLHTHENDTESVWLTKPSAHVLYNEDDSNPRGIRGTDGMYKITSWSIGGALFHLNKMDYRSQSGSFVIREEGQYYIYSQALFLFTYNSDDVTSEQAPRGETLVHSIFRNNIRRAQEEELLTGRKSNCWSANNSFVLQSNYLGGIVYLKAGDEIYVKVSDLNKIKTNDIKSTYFGLYML